MTRLLWILLVLVLVGSVLGDFVGPSKEVHHVWEHKTFFAFYGFLGCAVIVYVSKWIGTYWLQRPVDYYEPHQAPEPVRPAGEEGGENV